jgi:hypothetical protein
MEHVALSGDALRAAETQIVAQNNSLCSPRVGDRSVRMASATRNQVFGQIRSKKSASSNASGSWKRPAVKFSSVCLTMAPTERIEELGQQSVSRYCTAFPAASAGRCRVGGSIGFYSAQPISTTTRSSMALDRLPPLAFTAYGLQSIIQHVAHFPMGSGTGR